MHDAATGHYTGGRRARALRFSHSLAVVASTATAAFAWPDSNTGGIHVAYTWRHTSEWHHTSGIQVSGIIQVVYKWRGVVITVRFHESNEMHQGVAARQDGAVFLPLRISSDLVGSRWISEALFGSIRIYQDLF